MKALTLSIMLVVLVELGISLVMLNASPHPPAGFRLWFGTLAVIGPVAGYGVYRHMTRGA